MYDSAGIRGRIKFKDVRSIEGQSAEQHNSVAQIFWCGGRTGTAPKLAPKEVGDIFYGVQEIYEYYVKNSSKAFCHV